MIWPTNKPLYIAEELTEKKLEQMCGKELWEHWVSGWAKADKELFIEHQGPEEVRIWLMETETEAK